MSKKRQHKFSMILGKEQTNPLFFRPHPLHHTIFRQLIQFTPWSEKGMFPANNFTFPERFNNVSLWL